MTAGTRGAFLVVILGLRFVRHQPCCFINVDLVHVSLIPFIDAGYILYKRPNYQLKDSLLHEVKELTYKPTWRKNRQWRHTSFHQPRSHEVVQSLVAFYPGPRGFSWFSLRKRSRGSREAATTSRKSDEEREKNLWLPWPRISLSCRRQGQDLTLGRWLVDSFSNTQTNLIGSFNCNYRGDAEDFHTSFCLSLLGKKIVCMLHSQ